MLDPAVKGFSPVHAPPGGFTDGYLRPLIGRRVSIRLYTTSVYAEEKGVEDGSVVYDSYQKSPMPGVADGGMAEVRLPIRDIWRLEVAVP